MKAQLKALIPQLLPNVDAIPYILSALIPIIFIYFIFTSRKLTASLVAMLIVLGVMTPISYYDIEGIKGLQPIYLWWIVTFLAVILWRLASKGRFELRRFFSTPLLILFIIQAMAWAHTFLSSDHPFYQAGFDRWLLFRGYLLNPIQILLTGLMVMLATEEKQGMVVIQKAIMISAIIFGGLLTTIYLKTGVQAGGPDELFLGRLSINEIMGEENNGLAAICVLLFVGCVCMKDHGKRVLNIVSIGATLSGILFTLSRMAWVNTAFITLLMFPRMKWLIRIIVVLFFIGLYMHSHTLIVNRLLYGTEKDYFSREEQVDNITANRVSVWKASWQKIQESALFGSGIQTPVRVREGKWANHSHNAYLRTLVDMGVVGLLAVFLAYAYMLKISWRKSGLLFFSIVSLFVMGFVCLEFHPHKQNFLIWIFYGMSLNEIAGSAPSEGHSGQQGNLL